MRFVLVFFSMLFLGIAKPLISVSIPPQAYFLNQIAGESVETNTLIPQGSDPHTFEFKPSTLAKLQKSDLYLTIGLEFEEIWIPKIKDNLSKTQILPINEGIDYLHSQCNHSHHSHDSHHDEEEDDPHIWLSPKNAKILASNIAKILIAHYPQNKALYEKNLKAFLQKVDTLNSKLTQKLSSLKVREFIVYHPSWAYFAKDYNLIQIPIEIEGKEPKARELKHLIQTAKKHHIKVIFTQNGFSTLASNQIAKACGAHIFITDPLAYEWERELEKIASELEQWQK
ncbi:metal ABC transporter solute-binding protein, Zn/Mn family [Helicobacter brantae]|uniref:Cation ABC transporter substrate-binding protein n=1 Tax=Helicobacter brantae TaxID=375927 RepID=A0A3D8J3H7_9HELI|nr:zinc ABC transporter substrate-binding protein [Helicobacter brantae]RDU71705.1 cation ABC transporter substrate-binding protein [Helicobacter brantae]